MDVEIPTLSYFLYPSTLYVSKEPCLINTVLGSCVAICLWDTVLKIGGMNHYMMPLWNGDGLASPKYGNIAIPKLIENMLSYGSSRYNLRAKIFGGGEILQSSNPQFMIGERNINIAYELIADENIPVISHSIGGKLGRKIQFNTSTGVVYQKFIDKKEEK